MTWLALLIIVVGVVIVFMMIQVPRRMMRLRIETEARQTRTADLDARYARLSEMRIQARLIFEGAIRRDDAAFQNNEIEALTEMRAACDALLAGLHEASPILERYFLNLIAVFDYVLGGHNGKSSLPEAIIEALKELDRSQANEHSTHPICVMERKVATGRS